MSEDVPESLSMVLKRAKTKAEFQKGAVALGTNLAGLSADQDATLIGWHPGTVSKLQARYVHEGDPLIKTGR
ncbi:MAG: hypothetical protein A2169_11945 [Deltaproteobacteria bacterium RBG_13_47_9]|nr:MAG: hypothetical protein A2169_11945 [Deltaproteobacteria bacterium RBG_13_47_9]